MCTQQHILKALLLSLFSLTAHQCEKPSGATLSSSGGLGLATFESCSSSSALISPLHVPASIATSALVLPSIVLRHRRKVGSASTASRKLTSPSRAAWCTRYQPSAPSALATAPQLAHALLGAVHDQAHAGRGHAGRDAGILRQALGPGEQRLEGGDVGGQVAHVLRGVLVAVHARRDDADEPDEALDGALPGGVRSVRGDGGGGYARTTRPTAADAPSIGQGGVDGAGVAK